MTKREVSDFAIDFLTYFTICEECNDNAAEVVNSATIMIKEILERHSDIRKEIYEIGKHELLDKLGLDYGI